MAPQFSASSTPSPDREAAFQRALERHEQRMRRQETLFQSRAAMQRSGASPHTIATALRGLHLFLQATGQTSLELTPSPHLHEAFSLLSTIEPADSPALPLSEIPTLPGEWLWPQRIPLGCLTLLEGCPGSGTSLLAVFLAAAVSSGLPLPDGPCCPQGRVLLIAPHDNANSTIKPRLLAAGGDPSQVFSLPCTESLDAHASDLIDRPFSLATDLDHLHEAVARYEPLLVILDAPDTLTTRQRATILPRLADLAQSFGCAILLIHCARQPSASFSRGQLAAGGAPRDLLHLVRSALRIVPATSDEDDEEQPQFLLTCTKHSLDAGPTDLAFEIASDYLSPEAAAFAASPEQTPFSSLAPSNCEPALFAALSVPVLLWRAEPATSTSLLHRTVPLSRLRQVLLQTLAASPRPLTPKDVATLTGEGHAAVRQALRRMREDGEVVCPARGLYTTPQQATAQSSSPLSPTSPSSQPDPSPIPLSNPQPDLSPDQSTPSPLISQPASPPDQPIPSSPLSPASPTDQPPIPPTSSSSIPPFDSPPDPSLHPSPPSLASPSASPPDTQQPPSSPPGPIPPAYP